MSSAERSIRGWFARRAERHTVLAVLRAGSLDIGWSHRAATGAPARWCGVHVPIVGGASDGVPLADELRAAVRQAVELSTAPLRESRIPARFDLVMLVSAHWLGMTVLPWSDGLLRSDSVQVHARSELRARGFAAGAEDVVRIDVGPPLGSPRTALLWPAWLLPLAKHLASALGAKLASVQALESVAARWVVDRSTITGFHGAALVGLYAGGVLRLMRRDGRVPHAGHELTDASTAAGTPSQAAGLWRRARIRLPDLQRVPVLPILKLDEPPEADVVRSPGETHIGWVPWPGGGRERSALDRALLHQARRHRPLDAVVPSRTGNAACAVMAALCLASTLGLAWQAWQRQAPVDRPEIASGGATEAITPITRGELAEVRAVNAAVRHINLPLAELMRTLRPPADIGIVLLGLDVASRGQPGEAESGNAGERASGAIKLSVESSSAADMTRYVAFLAGRSGVSSAQLVQHEINPTRTPLTYRFGVELVWQR